MCVVVFGGLKKKQINIKTAVFLAVVFCNYPIVCWVVLGLSGVRSLHRISLID